jgi:hypothetical protein
VFPFLIKPCHLYKILDKVYDHRKYSKFIPLFTDGIVLDSLENNYFSLKKIVPQEMLMFTYKICNYLDLALIVVQAFVLRTPYPNFQIT